EDGGTVGGRRDRLAGCQGDVGGGVADLTGARGERDGRGGAQAGAGGLGDVAGVRVRRIVGGDDDAAAGRRDVAELGGAGAARIPRIVDVDRDGLGRDVAGLAEAVAAD